jgi:hypothetical protein|tara:strand:+ start:760 stop:966 length:207 start_codon:yes stop_codon:yes gene_type:complete
MPRFKIVDGQTIQLTSEEEAVKDAEINSEEYLNLKNAEQNAINKKASGKQKLKDLGLDDDEIQALIGV